MKGAAMEAEKRIDIINFMAPMNDSTVGRLIDLTYTAHAEGSSEIHLRLSSTGGKLHSAFTAYHFFRSLCIPFFTHNVGTLETAAIITYLASDTRSAVPNAKFLIYNLEWTFYRDHIRYPEIIEAYLSLKFDTESYVEIFNERTNKSFDVRAPLTGPAQVLDGRAALAAGVVTDPDIAAPTIPELAKLWSIHN